MVTPLRILDHECRDRHLWTLALYGLRRGEIAGLKWSSVDLSAETVTIEENRVVVERQVLTGTPKSKRSKPTLPMPTEVVDVLNAARKRQIEDRLAAGSQYRGEYLASNQLGEPLHPDAITSRWEKLLEDLGIPAVRLHDARHSCAWVSPEIVEASFKLRPAGWQRFSRTRPEPARLPSCAVV